MHSWHKRGLAAFAALAGFWTPAAVAAPMTFTLERTDGRPIGLDLFQIIFADGEITPTSAAEFRAFAARHRLVPDAHVYLNSPGGSVGGGLELGAAIRELGFRTDIGRSDDRPGICLSACAYAFLGGKFRYLREGSTYGVHRFSGGRNADEAQIVSGVLVAYIEEMGAKPDLFPLMTRSGSDEILPIPLAELRRLNVVTQSVARTEWDIQNLEEVGFYLRGTTLTDRGEHKLLFVCHDRQLFAMPMLESSDPAAVVATSGSANWIIDGDFQPSLAEGVGEPEAEAARVSTSVPVEPSLYRRLQGARAAGFAWVHRNKQIYSGFEISLADAHEKLGKFARTCNAELYR